MQNIFAEICKVNPETRMVYGYASTEAMDGQGEIVSKDALANALPAYMKFANIREMHQPSAVGVAKQATLDEKGLYLAVKVVADDAWNKVKEGVYKGFSIGGKTITKVDDTITELRLSEISLVDRPANPEAVIEVWKAEGIDASIRAIDELAKLLDAGAIKPEQLLAFAKTQETIQSVMEITKGEINGTIENTPNQILHRDSLVVIGTPPEIVTASGDAAAKDLTASELEGANSADIASVATHDDGKAEETGNLVKAGMEFSAKNMVKVQDLHDMCCSMGAKCQKDDMAMADKNADLSKVDGVLNKLTELESVITKMTADNDALKEIVERMNKLPAPSKAHLRAFNKADDSFDGEAPAPKVLDGGGNVNEAASLIKMIHQTGGVR